MRKDRIQKFKDSLFSYDNYRDFLKDYFNLQKSIRAKYTLKSFAEKAGLTSHTFCSYVISGKRNLSSKTIESFASTIGLDTTMTKFFTNLVLFNQTDTQEKKEQYYENLQKIRKLKKFSSISNKQSSFYEQPYNAVVRELAVHSPWSGSFKALAQLVYPSITTTQAKEAVELLLENGLLVQKGANYTFNRENLTDKDVPVFLKKRARRQVFERGVELLDNMSADKRFAAYTTFMSDRETYDQIEVAYKEFRAKVNELISNTKSKDEVFNMTFELFPISRNLKDTNIEELL